MSLAYDAFSLKLLISRYEPKVGVRCVELLEDLRSILTMMKVAFDAH